MRIDTKCHCELFRCGLAFGEGIRVPGRDLVDEAVFDAAAAQTIHMAHSIRSEAVIGFPNSSAMLPRL